ncbi:Filament-forming protein, partial [Coemansia sp. RSA 1933]
MEKQQTRDLERQVTGLLRATEESRTGGRSVPERPDSSRSSLGIADMHPSSSSSLDEEEKWLNDVDRVISQKLVAFSDINELVAQNRRLLRTTRELAAQVSQEEELQREINEDQVKDALEQAEALLDRLSIEFDDTKRRLGVVERERDMLKSIKGQDKESKGAPVATSLENMTSVLDSSASHQLDDEPVVREGGNGAEGSHTLQLAQLQDDFDTYKSETRKTRAQLERDSSKMQAELSELRVRAAKAESQNQFDSDRIQMFTRDLEARQKEIEHLRLATSRLHTQAESYERQLDTTTQSMTTDRVELSKLRRQTAVLEAERDNLAAYEKRWRSEEQRLIAERASLTQILENTTKMRDEWQKSSEQQVTQVRERLEAARKEADAVRVELRQAREANERAQFKNEAELREVRGQIEQREARVVQLQDQIVENKEAYVKLQGEKREVEVSAEALQRQVVVLEARIQSQETLMQRAKGQGQEVSKESLLTVQLQDTRSQIESLQSELATTSKRAEDYRQLSSTNENSLDELTRTYDQYKAEQERVASEQKTRVQRLEVSLHEAQESLTSCQTDLEAARQAAQTAETALETHKSEIASRLTQLEDAVAQKTQSLASLRDDMQRHEQSAQSLQEQYEREIVAHAKDIEGTLLAREKLRETQSKLAATAEELQACELANARFKQEERKIRDRADQDVKAAEAQLAEIRRQNSLLLAHLESLGHQVPDISVDPEQISSIESGAPPNDQGEEEGGNASAVPSATSNLRD